MPELLYYFSRCWPLLCHCRKEKERKREQKRLCNPAVLSRPSVARTLSPITAQTEIYKQTHLLCRYSNVLSLSLSLFAFSHLPSLAKKQPAPVVVVVPRFSVGHIHFCTDSSRRAATSAKSGIFLMAICCCYFICSS